MYSLGFPDSVYLPRSLPVRVGDTYVDLRPPATRQEGSHKLWFLSGLTTAAGAMHRVFLL